MFFFFFVISGNPLLGSQATIFLFGCINGDDSYKAGSNF